MPRLCQYSDALGVPGEGVHSVRFMGVALADVIMTIVAGLVISKLTGFSIWAVLIVLLISAIFLHWLFCVDTALNVTLGIV